MSASVRMSVVGMASDPQSGCPVKKTAVREILELLLRLSPDVISSLLNSKVRDVVNGERELRLDRQDFVLLARNVQVVAALTELGGGGFRSTSGCDLGLCLLLGFAGSLKNLQRLNITGLPGGTSVESGEEAVEVLFGALELQGGACRLRQLTLVGHEVFGTERVCGLLAGLLRSEDCKLDGLTLHATTRVGGMKCIAEALEGNTSVRTLKVVGCDLQDVGVEYLAGMLRKNTGIQDLSLHDIGLTGTGMEHLCRAMCEATCVPLTRLKLHENKGIGKSGVKHLGNMLAHNRCLEKLIVTSCELEDEEGRLAEGLRNNSTLKELNLDDNRMGKTGLEPLFRCLAASTARLEILDIGRDAGELPGSEELAALLASNQSLQRLDLTAAGYSSADWVSLILPSVAHNPKLRIISIVECPGIDVDAVLPALLELLRINLVLEEIHIDGTPLKSSGKAVDLFEAVQSNKQFRAALPVVRTSQPNSGKIVLFGKEYAGKSTLLETMKRLQESPGGSLHRVKHRGCKLWQTKVAPLFKNTALDKDIRNRTRGIEMHELRKEDPRIHVWDFAGHKEFHGLQDFIFPKAKNSATLFVITLSPLVSPLEKANAGKEKANDDMVEELLYWLKYINSNSQPGASRPWVVFVITNKDNLRPHMLKGLTIWANDTLAHLAGRFEGLLTLWPRPYILNALLEEDVKCFVEDMDREFRIKLTELPPEPVLCEQVAKALGSYQFSPIVSVTEFEGICKSIANQIRDPEIRHSCLAFLGNGDKGWREVASDLHNKGILMYYERLQFIVRNPSWFGHGVLGHLRDMFSDGHKSERDLLRSCFKQPRRGRKPGYLPKDGFISKKSLRELLSSALQYVGVDPLTVSTDELIQLLLVLDLCYEWKKPGMSESGYLLPAIFEDEEDRGANGKRQLEWTEMSSTPRRRPIFLGRRLTCADPSRTFLTPGFFPRLQLVLRNNGPWVMEDSMCSLGNNLLRIVYNGMEILLEYSGYSGYFVDILVRSSQSFVETLDFVDADIVGRVSTFCDSREGCQGVTLTEAVIRPDCVREEPTLCAYRRTQSVPVKHLRDKMESEPSYKHSWAEVMDEGGHIVVAAGEDDAQFLLTGVQLGGEEWRDETGKQIHITKDDVGQLRELVARLSFGKAVPFKLHLKCNIGQHIVKGQRGRMFYVVDERFDMEQNLRSLLTKLTTAALSVGSSALPGLSAAVEPANVLLQFKDSPAYTETIETISKRIKKTPATISDEELRKEVERDLNHSCESAWMVEFLNVQTGEKAFRDDFGLRKVESSRNSNSVQSLVCDHHWTLGRNDGELRGI